MAARELAEGRRATGRVTALAALAASSRTLASGTAPAGALHAVVEAALAACTADVALLRVVAGETAVVRAVAAASTARAAELHGLSAPLHELPTAPEDDLELLSPAIAATAASCGATAALALPLGGSGERGWLEVYRHGRPFGAGERLAASIAADHALLALHEDERRGPRGGPADPLEMAGDALAAASDPERTAEGVARLAARAAGAEAAWLWRLDGHGGIQLVAAHGQGSAPPAETAASIVPGTRAYAVGVDGDPRLATLQLGQPPLGALQLRFAPGREPDEQALARLATFAVRAAHALRAGERVREAVGELERTRALLDVVGQAISELSLAHTVETAAVRMTALLGTERVAVYLVEPDTGLVAAAPGPLTGPHERVAARLLEVALGPARGRGLLFVPDAAAEPALTVGLDDAWAESGIEAAIALPLVVAGDVTGLLAAYPERGRALTESESALLVALAAQLAVAVQNARLHEREKTLAAEREQALASLRVAHRRQTASSEIARSVAPNIPFDETLRAVARAMGTWLEVDAAALHLPDARGAELEPRALHVSDPRLAEVARTILERPQPLTRALGRLQRTRQPLALTAALAAELGGAHALLAPFLAKGSTAGVVPIATTEEVLGALTIVSFDAGRPVTEETLAAAASISPQAALAIDNARLYEHEKRFADTIQRSLLPRSAPTVPGLELGDVYESSARVEVGGDVYDYLTLADGRLAVVLGDVTGHGIDATADMAMAKYVFRSLAREHDEPGDFLAAANDVVAGEIATGKFITMVELVVDAARNRLRCASAGHPAPRLIQADGTVEAIPVRGLALGIEEHQEYESLEVELAPGATVVIFTDGVIEARRGGELFGLERLDRVLAAERHRPAGEIARAVLAECRRFGGGELVDDCAVVVISRR